MTSLPPADESDPTETIEFSVLDSPSDAAEAPVEGLSLIVASGPRQGLHWPLENVPGECTYESWTTLDGANVTMRFRATNARPDRTSPFSDASPALAASRIANGIRTTS